jgi:hypothetical protein
MIDQVKRNLPRSMRSFTSKIRFEYRKATWRTRPLPEFIIIGVQKSGTSSMHDCLIQHPQLFSSPFRKEIHFFDKGALEEENSINIKNEAWYRAHFPSEQERGAGSRTFENTPNYLYNPLVPERIFNLIPEVKLIALLRNPADRAISHFFMCQRKNVEHLPMLEAFQQEEERIEKLSMEKNTGRELTQISYKSLGRYAEQLKIYLQFFPIERIMLLKSEEFFNDPHKSLRRVFDFVGVDPNFIVPNVTPRNVGMGKSEVPLVVSEYLDEYFTPYNHALYELTGQNFGW